MPGLAPRRLTRDIADAIAALATSISQQRRPDFDVAIRRTISGMTSRGDPSDALVDLVIGWENLFGADQELSFRISASIAAILGADAPQRRRLQKQCGQIYTDRSKIVHGQALGRLEAAAGVAGRAAAPAPVRRHLDCSDIVDHGASIAEA